jgi:hypothetical protein
VAPDWGDDVDDQWLDVLRPFTAVKDLYLSQGVVPRIADTLAEASRTEVLPALQNLFLYLFSDYSEEFYSLGAVREAIDQFVAARRLLSGQQIDAFYRDCKREEESEVDGLPVLDDSSGFDYLSVLDDASLLDFPSVPSDSSVLNYSPVLHASSALNYSPVPDNSSVPDDSSVLDD